MARIIGTERGAGSDDSSGGGSSGMRNGGRQGGRKPSFKTRGTHGPHGHARNIRATKVTLPVSKVRELASKFNAVVVDRESEGRALLSSHRGIPSALRTSAAVLASPAAGSTAAQPSSVVLATIQRFEGIMMDHKSLRSGERPKRVLVRTNSCAREIPVEKLKNVPETVPEEKSKSPEERKNPPEKQNEIIEENPSDNRSEIFKRLEDSSQGLTNDVPANTRSTTGVVTKNVSVLPGKPLSDKSKPVIKPKPPDLSHNYRGSLGNIHKVSYKENYSRNNKRLSLPKVAILDELLTDEDKLKRPNSSFLWSGKTEKPEVGPGSLEVETIKPEVEPRNFEIELRKPDIEPRKSEVELGKPSQDPNEPDAGTDILSKNSGFPEIPPNHSSELTDYVLRNLEFTDISPRNSGAPDVLPTADDSKGYGRIDVPAQPDQCTKEGNKPASEVASTAHNNAEDSIDRASLVANKSSLYRHLGRSQECVSSLRRSQENIGCVLGRSRESVVSEGHVPHDLSRVSELIEKRGSRSSLGGANTVKCSSEVAKDVNDNATVPGTRVSFHIPPEQTRRKSEEVKSKKTERSLSIISNASYEDIGPGSRTYEDVTENNYAVIADYDDTEAIYDDVLNVVSQAAEGIYECIYSGGGPKDDSDSSLEHQNSLYDHRPASQASSGSGGRHSAASKSDTSDEWMDIESEDKDRKEEFILLEEKTKPKNLHDSWSQRVRRQWSHKIAEEFKLSRVAISSPSKVYILGPDSDVKQPSYGDTLEALRPTKGLVSLRDIVYFGENYEDQEVTVHLRNEGEPSEEVYEPSPLYDESVILDDFDDSSDSDGEVGGRSGGFDLVQAHNGTSSSPPQSGGGSGRENEGIYGLMMSAGKKVKKTSWSISQRLRRRMSKISISSGLSIPNGGETINGGVETSNQKRWPSFKKKSKGSTSKFYLETARSPPPEPSGPPLATASLPLVLPPFKESKRPSLEIPPSLPHSAASAPASPRQQSSPLATASLPLVLPPLKESQLRRPSPPPVPPPPSSRSSPPSSVDSRRLSTALPSAPRPTSPPPPPPPLVNGDSKSASKSVNDPTLYVESGLFGSTHPQPQQVIINQTNFSSSNDVNSKSHSNSQWYSDAGLYENASNENGKPQWKGDEPLPDAPVRRVSNSCWYSDLGIECKYAPSELDSGQGSQLDLQFADEPLYQFYAARVAELEQSENNSDIGYEEIGSNSDPSPEIYSPSDVSVGSAGSGGGRPSALDLVSPESIHRTLWCQVPQVINSGILESLTANQKRLQEAKFELITSEASYYKSLIVLERTFANSPVFKDETVIPKVDYKTLFGNIVPVRKCSESMLAGLEKCWQESILLEGVCEVLLQIAKDKFSAYIRYCSHQIAIERTLKRLKKNPIFSEKLETLESSPACHSLSLSSFLLLPMQRVTRLPLLLDAIMTKLESGSSEFESCQTALLALNKVVHDCNEAARQTERLEEMVALSRALTFPKHLRPVPLMSASRWLVRSGQVLQYNPDMKLTFSKKLTAPRQTKLTLFLFSDLFFITKKKGEDSFNVITYCQRNFVQMSPLDDPLAVPGTIPSRFLLSITILENHEGKTQELMVSCNSESCRERWLQPFSRPTSEDPDEVLYETWDCPQVVASHGYSSFQPDELSLQPGDVVNVLTKMADGWFYGERLRDSEKGWFPGNHVAEVASAHVRARNLRQRHRLLALSSTIIQQRQLQC